MFAVIRFLILGVICGGYFLWARATRVANLRTKCIVCLIATGSLLTVSSLVPLENLFINFSSPTAAYKYMRPWDDSIKLVVAGGVCDLVVAGDMNTDEFLILPKNSDGWQLASGRETKCVMRKVQNGTSIVLYQYKNTSNYFAVVCNPEQAGDAIVDSLNSEFISVERSNPALDLVFYVHYAYVHNPDESYQITLNGEKISVFN